VEATLRIGREVVVAALHSTFGRSWRGQSLIPVTSPLQAACQAAAPSLQFGKTSLAGPMKATRSTGQPVLCDSIHSGLRRVDLDGVARLVGDRRRPDPSADLFGQLDDDSLGAADVAEPVAVLVAHQLADELGVAGL